jgi:hypothetical protein
MKRPDQTFIRRLAAMLLLFSMALAAQDSDVIHRVKENIYWLRFAEADSLIEATYRTCADRPGPDLLPRL